MNPRFDSIGYIGLGNMGSAMVRRLVDAGYQIKTWTRSAHRYDSLSDLPLDRQACASALFRACDLVFLNVTSTADVTELTLGPQGALTHARAGTLVVDFSTIDSQQTQHIAHQLATKQIRFMDCPVSGGKSGAQAGSLSMMAGGDPADFEAIKPILAHLGQSLVHTGPVGTGQTLKAVNQMALCIQLAGLAESFNYARQQGVDLAMCLKILTAGLPASRVLDWAGPHMAEQFSRPASIEARLHAKDLMMVAQAAQNQGLNLPLLEQTANWLGSMMKEGLGHHDTSEIFKIVEAQMFKKSV